MQTLLNEFHKTMVCEVLREVPTDEYAIGIMALLHCYRLRVKPATILDSPHITVLASITQRHAAECIALLFPSTDSRSDYRYWLYEWNSKRIPETSQEFAKEFRNRILGIGNDLISSGWIEEVIDDE